MIPLKLFVTFCHEVILMTYDFFNKQLNESSVDIGKSVAGRSQWI